MKKAVILISGGMDSVTLLYYIINVLKYQKIFCLSFNYGQKHLRELNYAKKNINKLSQVSDYQILDISFMKDFLNQRSSLIKGGEKVPVFTEIKENLDQPITYVPNRNMMMLSIASAYAESKNCSDLFYAAQVHDSYGYWDCTEEFLKKINQILLLNRRDSVIVYAPFINWSKAKIIKEGLKLGVNYADTWTCYRGEEKPCLECPSCFERLEAFKKNNYADPYK